MRRIAVVGTPGCGKSTLARALARQTGLPHIELDTIKFRADWTAISDDLFRELIAVTVRDDRWIIDGNYEAVRDIVWVRAQVVVWLDYSLAVVLQRLCCRTIRRLLTAERFMNGNRESFWRVFGPRSVVFWPLRMHRRRRRFFEALLAEPRYSHLRVVRLRSPADATAWLRLNG
jgi:adenylate kinase family enzyme